IALIVTILVSLTLLAMGLLVNFQAHKAEQHWGSKLQITAFLCNQHSQSPTCDKHNVTDTQKKQIRQVLSRSNEVAAYHWESKKEAFDKFKKLYVAKNKSKHRIYATVKPKDMQETYWITLNDPTDRSKYDALESQLSGM